MGNIWTPESIEYFRRSSEYTSFHKKLSVLAEPYLDDIWTLVDIGCGPGLFEPWLAPMVASIDAVDIDTAAIDYLTAKLEDVFATSSDIANKVKPVLADIKDLEGAWDVALLSFFGVNNDVIETVLRLARRRIIVFMHGRREVTGPFSRGSGEGKFTAPEMEAYLDESGLAYRKNVMEMQFGQPFKTIEEVQAFVRENSDVRGAASIEERIVKTNRFDYPFYLPRSISVALFIIAVNRGER